MDNFRSMLKQMEVNRTDDQIKDTYKDQQEDVDVETVFNTLASDDEEMRSDVKREKLRKRFLARRKQTPSKSSI
jgi:hypothetical protein